ncbi:RTA1-domain-containing protein [Myriangium duriaei CBS 260.36]|uniref:RTA1-domain-containing protein n=1 Tax=Myriangium duriaei CBS 260.36 TaxID=1168546 RepID=A0A9P4J138_9PEZI|nr:RTA1-domain-containing protein [Myriangium duriaei CBS 260.36]
MSTAVIDDQLAWLANGQVYFAGGKNSNCTIDVCPVELSVYGYRPSLAASGTLIALYAICLVIQLILGFRYRSWWFMCSMILGCFDEILGYVGRILYWQNPWAQTGFILQIVLITIGPVFFAAAIYVLLAQIVRYISPSHSRFDPKWYLRIFLPCDIISLILQAVGGGMSSSSNGKSNAAVDIALAGLSFQVATLVIFIALVVDYAISSRSVWKSTRLSLRFKVFCIALSGAILTILARCSYRIYELSEGYSRDSKALRDEPLFIVFESVMIIVAAYLLIVAHPGLVFDEGEEKLSKEERASSV